MAIQLRSQSPSFPSPLPSLLRSLPCFCPPPSAALPSLPPPSHLHSLCFPSSLLHSPCCLKSNSRRSHINFDQSGGLICLAEETETYRRRFGYTEMKKARRPVSENIYTQTFALHFICRHREAKYIPQMLYLPGRPRQKVGARHLQ